MTQTTVKSRIEALTTYGALGACSTAYTFFRHFPLGAVRNELLSVSGKQNLQQVNPLAGLLLDHFTTQFNASSCSVASVATVVNALRQKYATGPLPVKLTQQRILDDVTADHWKERVSPDGYRGRRGLPLANLGEAVEQTLIRYKIPYLTVQTVSINRKNRDRLSRDLFGKLAAMEQLGSALMIAHFDQGVFLKTLHLPHISPVGAFDRKGRRVLILDVDPTQPSPYWVSYRTFFTGLSSQYFGILEKYGYTSGGYVWIRLRSDTPPQPQG